jgi:hypothetical protein
MLVPNCIFRSNGAAILLSNKRSDAWRCKYELQHVVRTMISSDEAFGCVYQMEDDKGGCEQLDGHTRQQEWHRGRVRAFDAARSARRLPRQTSC